MASLMDMIKKNLTGNTAATPQPQLGQTERAQSLLEAKLGKQTAGETGPARSTIQEKSALQQTQAGLQAQSLEDRLKAEQLKTAETEQEVKAQEAEQNLVSQLQDYQSAFERQADNLLGDFERDTRQLEDSKKASKLEQLGFLMRLQDQQYVSDLQRAGEMNRLNQGLSFKEAYAQQDMDNLLGLFKNQQDFQRFVGMSDRQFQEQLFNMDINFAIEMADSLQKAQKNQMIFSGIGSMIGAGASLYIEKNKDTNNKPGAK